MNDVVVEKIVTVIDLSRYSDICNELEQQLDVTAVAAVNRQIKDLIELALAAAGIASDGLPFKGTGDGAIIALDTAQQGSMFAEKLHGEAARHNRGKNVHLAQRHFRVGVWSGKIVLQPAPHERGQASKFDFAGSSIGFAVRLEGACKTGEVLISSDTWADLPADVRALYGPEEVVKGKRAEEFRAHRRRVTDPAPWDSAPVPDVKGEKGSGKAALVDMHKRRLAILEKQAAMFGSLTPAHITIEIEDIKKIISELDR
jgi:class 3 adenylate cyclase